LRELGLRPGATIDPAMFTRDPQVAEYVSTITQRQQQQKQQDWAGLCRYRAENAVQIQKPAPDVVFLGDSITENWIHADPAYFSDKVIDRGISGQTTSQILLRFYPDVVALRPRVVHIMAGTNDLLQDVGPVGDDDIVNNISAMLDIAAANRIEVVLGSILPISVRPWRPTVRPAARLLRLNRRLKELAASRQVQFVDYFAAMKDDENGLRTDLGNDGVHPNRAGYAVMRPLAQSAIDRRLR
jgi:lysophospholipase L1-like esterase